MLVYGAVATKARLIDVVLVVAICVLMWLATLDFQKLGVKAVLMPMVEPSAAAAMAGMVLGDLSL